MWFRHPAATVFVAFSAVRIGDDRCSFICKRRASIRMVEMPMCVDEPAAIDEAPKQLHCVSQRREGHSQCRSASSRQRENIWRNLGHDQRSALVRPSGVSRYAAYRLAPCSNRFSSLPVVFMRFSKRALTHLTSKELTCGLRLEINCHPFAGEISRACISYLKLSGSRASRRPCAVSACGYIKNPTGPLFAPGRATSCAKL